MLMPASSPAALAAVPLQRPPPVERPSASSSLPRVSQLLRDGSHLHVQFQLCDCWFAAPCPAPPASRCPAGLTSFRFLHYVVLRFEKFLSTFCACCRSDTISVDGLMQLAATDPSELKDATKRETAAAASQPAAAQQA